MKKKINVLYILTKLELGGAQKICLSLIDGLINEGHYAGLISGDQGPLVDQARKYKHTFLIESFKREVSLKNLIGELKTLVKIINYIRRIRKNNPDLLVHTHSTKAGIIGRWAAFFAGVKKIIHTVHGFGFNDQQSKSVWLIIYFLELITSFITTKYICVSQRDLDQGARIIPWFLEKSTIIRAAVDWERFYIPANRTDYFSKNKLIIGTISCFKPQKNLFDLLKAFKFVCENLSKDYDDLILQIIGDGDQRERIEDWIRKNNFLTKIELLGWQNDVSIFMRGWSVYVMSSLWEGLPCSVVEARLSRIPVIAYDVGGIYEVINNGKNGFLIQPGDWKTLAEKIILIISDNRLQKNMSLYTDNFVEFKNSSMIQRHIDFYKNL